MNKSVLRYFLVAALLLGLLIAPLSTVRAQDVSVWDGTYPTDRPADMDTPDDGILEVRTAAEFAWLTRQANMYAGYNGALTIKLMTDIDLADHPWTPGGGLLGDSSDVFDGNGHTISNLKVTYPKYAGLFNGAIATSQTIKNLTIENANVEATTTTAPEGMETYAGVLVGTHEWRANYENVHINNATVKATKYAGGLSAYGSSDFINCSVNNVDLIVQEIGDEKPHVGGFTGLNNFGTLDNSTVNNVNITITSTDGVIDTTRVGTLIGTAQKDVVINPNSTATNVTYNGDPYTNIVGLDNRKDTNWYDAAGDNYEITTVEQLLGLDSLLNAGTTFLGKTVLLDADIDLYGQSFFPLGSATNTFQGTFDGQNYTLSNLSLTQTTNYAGFFARIDEGGVRNLNIDGFYVKAPQYAGGVAGQMFRASFENVHVSNTTILSDHFGGGVTGHLYGNAKNSSATSVTVKAHNEVPGELGNKLGGLAGYVGEGNYVLENNIGTNVTVIGIRDVGGLFGTTNKNNKVYTNTITNSTVTASNQHGSETDPWAGGIVGRLGGKFTTFRGNVNNNTTVTSYDPAFAGPIYGGPAANANDERVFNQTQGTWHTSISAAITAAAENDVLSAGPGIYPENIAINKKITLNGAGENSAFGASPATVQGLIDITASGVTINDLKVAPGSVTEQVAAVKISANNVTLNRNLIDGMTGNGDYTIKGIYVYSASGISNIVIDDNVVRNINNNTAKGLSGIMIQGIVDTVTISNNTVENIHSEGWAYGIEVTPTSNPANAIPQNVSITGNTIINITAPIGGVGLSIDRVNANYTADASQVTVNNNKFLGPVNNYAIVNKDPNHTLNATSNFYGVNVNPEDVILHHPETIGDIQLGPVQYIPFYGDEAMNELVNETTLEIAPDTTEACGTESEMIIAVNVGAVNYTNSYQVDIEFDPTQIEIVDAYNGDVFTGALLEAEKITPGATLSTLSYGNSTVGTGGVFRHIKDDNGGVLMYLKVKRLTPGNSTLTLLGSSFLTIGEGQVDHPYAMGNNLANIVVGDPVISIGTNLYCDLQSAVTAAVDNDELIVLRDFNTTAPVIIEGKTITFNTGTFTVTRTEAANAYDNVFTVKTGSDLTITGTGTLNSTSTDGTKGAALRIEGGEVTLAGATLKGDYASVNVRGNLTGTDPISAVFNMSSGTTTNGIYIFGYGSKLNVSGGNVTATGNKAAISGNNLAPGTEIIIGGNAVVTSENIAIYHPQNGTLTIKDNAQVTGTNGIEMREGNFTMTGGIVKGVGTNFVSDPESGKSWDTGDALLVTSIYDNNITVNISGGKLESAHAYAFREYVPSDKTTKVTEIKVTGGTFDLSTGNTKEDAVSFDTTDSGILKLTGGLYKKDPSEFVFHPLETYLDPDGYYHIRDMWPIRNVQKDKIYSTLAEAVTEVANGQTLEVRRNFETTAAVLVTKSFTFDTKGYTVTRTEATGAYDSLFEVYGPSNLTITGGGTLNTTSTGNNLGAALKILGGEVTLQNATLKGDYVSVRVEGNNDAPTWETPRPAVFKVTGGTVADGVVIVGNGAKLDLSGGTVTSERLFAAIQGQGRSDDEINNGGTEIIIRDNAQVTRTKNDIVIYHPQRGKLTINGGTITGDSPIYMKSGELTVTGGTITATGAFVAEPVLHSSGAYPTGDAIFLLNQDGYKGDIRLKITGGTITSTNGYAVREFTATDEETGDPHETRTTSIKISGGRMTGGTGAGKAVTFATTAESILKLTGGAYNVDPAVFVYFPWETYLHTDNYYYIRDMWPVKNTSTGVIYETLALAVAGAQPGETLQARRDFNTPGVVKVDNTIIFDTNGKTITRTNAGGVYSNVLYVMTGGNLTITGTGTVKSTNDEDTNGTPIVVYGGTLNLQGATLSGGYASVAVFADFDTENPTPGTFNMSSGMTTDGVIVQENGSTFNLTGGTVKTTKNQFAIAGNGTLGFGGTIINIGGDAKVISEQTLAIFHPQDGTLTISGNAEISGPSGIQMKSGDLIISGTPTITATGTFVADPEPPTNGAQPTGDAIFIVSQSNYTGDLNLNISGGTITSDNGYAVREFVGSGTTKLDNATISDGQLSGGAGAVDFASDTDDVLDLIGGAYNTDPSEFVFDPKYVYFDDPWYRIGDKVGPVTGTISMQARTVRAGVPVTLTGATFGGTNTATSTDAYGPNLTFSWLAPDTYTITTAQPRYLNIYANLNKTVVISGSNKVIAPLQLIAGNAVWEIAEGAIDAIDELDAGHIGTYFMQTGADLDADVNFDGKVDIRDLALVGGNFGLTSQTAYQNWTP